MTDGSLEAYILSEIAGAEHLYARHAEAACRDGQLTRLLAVYDDAIRRREALMEEMGVGAACAVCSAGEKGSCCFPGIERGYDRVLLFVNLLMGCSLPTHSRLPGSCFFVGPAGCTLKARYYFCLHYFCPHLQTLLGPASIRQVLAVLGEELSAGWDLEQATRRWLSFTDIHG